MTLKELRKRNKKTLAEVAAVLHVAVTTLHGYEQGYRRLNVEQIIPLAEYYGVNERDIVLAQLESLTSRFKLKRNTKES